MWLRVDTRRSSFFVALALLMYLYWILDFLVIQHSWLIFAATPALIPVRRACLAAIAVIITACCLAFLLLSERSFNASAVAIACSVIPVVMALESRRNALVTRWFAAAVPDTPGRRFVILWRRTCIMLGILMLAPSISRDYPAEIAVSFALAAFITAWSLPGPARGDRSVRRVTFNGVLAIVGLAVGFAALEFGARQFIRVPSPETGMLQPDPKTIFRLRPSRSADLHYLADDGTTSQVRADISAQGLRDREYGPKLPGEYRILLIGDSFTYGQTVELGETISRQLEMRLRNGAAERKYYVINLGVPATGPWQQQMFLEEIGFGLEPDLVIHQLFLGNDPHDTLAREERYLRLFSGDWVVELERLRMLGTRRFRAEQWLADHSRAYLAFRQTVGRTTITRFLARGCRLLPRFAMEPVPQTKLIPPTWEVNNAEWYPDIPQTLDSIVDTLSAMRDSCAARDIPYMVYTVPIAEEVVPGWYEEARAKHRVPRADQYEMGKGQRYLDAQLAAHGLESIPVPECMDAQPFPERLYLKIDGHTTAAGNATIAQCLFDYLSSRTAVP